MTAYNTITGWKESVKTGDSKAVGAERNALKAAFGGNASIDWCDSDAA